MHNYAYIFLNKKNYTYFECLPSVILNDDNIFVEYIVDGHGL